MVGLVTPEKEARKWGVSARSKGITLIRTFYAYFPVFLAIIYNRSKGKFSILERRARTLPDIGTGGIFYPVDSRFFSKFG